MRVKSFSCGGPSSYEAILWANYFFSNLAMSLRITLVFPHCSCLDGDNPRYIEVEAMPLCLCHVTQTIIGFQHINNEYLHVQQVVLMT